ncbi:hypothetical protein HMPREF1567_0756 [Providencia alcalifaciens PAL-2]|nr:hypothetical protein HMPREF1567_0756 [Providencia alcalifaciens PAL-2]
MMSITTNAYQVSNSLLTGHHSEKHFANLKRGEFTSFVIVVGTHWKGLIGVTTRGGIEFCHSIKKGSQSATLGYVDIKYRASENINTSLLLWYGKYQLLGSMPRDFNSFLMMRFSQAAKDSSPSCACASSIIARNSGSNLNWKGGLPRRSLLCVDTLITPIVMYLCVITHYIHICKKSTPRSAGTLSRRLTTMLYEVTLWLCISLPKLALNSYGAFSHVSNLSISSLLLPANKRLVQCCLILLACSLLVLQKEKAYEQFTPR